MRETVRRTALKPGSKLLWYLIERVLGQGSFGITYLAQDRNLDRRVAIKEYLRRGWRDATPTATSTRLPRMSTPSTAGGWSALSPRHAPWRSASIPTACGC